MPLVLRTIVEQSMRLAGGSNSREGRVEVYYNSTWGTVCSDGFGVEEAIVVCRQMSYM